MLPLDTTAFFGLHILSGEFFWEVASITSG